MSKIRALAESRPFVFVIAVFLFESLLALPFVAVFKAAGWDIVPLRLIIPLAQSIAMVALVAWLGWFARSGFTTTVRDVHLYWYPVLLAFVPTLLYGTVEIAWGWVLFYTLAVLFTGISEEVIARGIILPALLPRGKWVALFLSAALFSVGHFSNLFFEDFGLLETAEKLLNTFGFAVLYGALFLRTGNIYPLIVLHALHDYVYVVSGTAGPFLAEPLSLPLSFALAAISIAYGVSLLRGWRPPAP